MALPCALFSSSADDFKPQEFIKSILKAPELPQPKIEGDSIESYEWSFETKYYSTTIRLCTTENRTIGNKDFADSVEAFIHFFDPNVPSSFELAKAWVPYLKHIDPDVLMLVCKTSRHSDAVERKVALEWCIKNGFELVELKPDDDSDDEDDDFPETTGTARIIQALHAHTWPNLEMKSSPTVQSPYLRQLMKEQHLLNQNQDQSSENVPNSPAVTTPGLGDTDEKKSPSHNSSANTSSQFEDSFEGNKSSNNSFTSASEHLEGASSQSDSVSASNAQRGGAALLPDAGDILGLNDLNWRSMLGYEEGAAADDEADMEDFEKLFMKLQVMKGKAETLAPDERKKYAEQMAISFWKAIGGDEDEIDGLDGLDGELY